MKSKKLKRNLVWVDPPREDEEPPTDWGKHLKPLKQRPDEWALVVSGYPSSIHAIHRYVTVTQPAEEWEFTVKPIDMVRAGLWAKYVRQP